MQEDVENRAIHLAVSTTRLTLRGFASLLQKVARHLQGQRVEDLHPRGKQTVKQLIGQNQGVSTIDIASTQIRGFQRVARKYGVDFAIQKDRSQDPPRYLVFFKARDADALTAAFQEFSAKVLRREKRPSVVQLLHQFRQRVAEREPQVKHKSRERER